MHNLNHTRPRAMWHVFVVVGLGRGDSPLSRTAHMNREHNMYML